MERGRGRGGELRRSTKKKHERENLAEKNSFTARSLRKILASAFRRILQKILAMRVREQTVVISFWNKKVPSFLASVQSDILTSKLFIYLFNSFTTVNQHSEGITQDCVPININPKITHPTHERLTTPVGSTSPTLFEQQCSLNDLQPRAVVASFLHKRSINSQWEPPRNH